MSARRDPRGRFVKRLRETPDGSREWLIWSSYHGAWHRRSSVGGACGYTDDIADAGLFERRLACAYHGDGRNTAIHVTEAYSKIVAAITRHEEALSCLADKTAALWRLRSAASGMSAFGQDPKGLEAKPASAVPVATPGDAQHPHPSN